MSFKQSGKVQILKNNTNICINGNYLGKNAQFLYFGNSTVESQLDLSNLIITQTEKAPEFETEEIK